MAKPNGSDLKGEFLTELIEKRNYWLSKVAPEYAHSDEAREYAQAYEKLICAVTTPPKTT